VFNTTTTLPIRADVDIGAFFDRDRDLEAPIKRRLLLTYVCLRRNPNATADEINRRFHITQSAKDVAKYLTYLDVLDHKLRFAFRGVNFNSSIEIIAHMPQWIKYGSTVELFKDLKDLRNM